MTEDDLKFLALLAKEHLIQEPVLELGAGYGGVTARTLIEGAGLEYVGTDLFNSSGVDYIANFEDDNCVDQFDKRTFGTVLVLNVLEHVFQPKAVLDNAIALTRPGGIIVSVTPCVWPVHNYPADYQRLLPDWYVRYAEGGIEVSLLEEYFQFLGHGPVSEFTSEDGVRNLPLASSSRLHHVYSRILHRLLLTSGRGKWTVNHCAIGAVFLKRRQGEMGEAL